MSAPDFATDGEVRAIGALPPNPVVDAVGTTPDQGPVLDTRIRLAASVAWETVTLQGELDQVTGQILGDTWAFGQTTDTRGRDRLDALTLAGLVPRRASVRWRTGAFEAEGGLVPSRWGLGMLANDGAGDPLFGRTDFGDRVVRARFTTAPVENLYTSVAGDLVVADEVARLANGERALQGIASVLYADKTGKKLGTYLVYRDQREADVERFTRVGVIDAFGDVALGPRDGWIVRLAAEGALITGHTDKASSYNSRTGLGVLAGGAAVQTALETASWTAHLRGGWASGDGAPDDDASHAFGFDPDYDAGMVLFDEVLAAIEAGAQAQLLDPANSAAPPDGYDALTHEGAVVGASYLQPAFTVRPREWLDLRVGAVVGWSTAPVGQAFASFRNGGVAAGPGGVATDGYALGSEVDWAMGIGRPVGDDNKPRPQGLVQGGHAFLSDNLGGGRADLLLAAARLRW